MREFNQGFARVNWKGFRELTKPTKKASPYWSKPKGSRSVVKFIPNPSTTPEKLVRVKLSSGRKAKLFRAPKVKLVVVHEDRNVSGRKEKNTCTVNALSILTGTPWAASRKAMQDAGRRPGRRFYGIEAAIQGQKVNGFKFRSVIRKPLSLAKFLVKHPVGKFFACTQTHAFAVIDGKIHHNSTSKSRLSVRSLIRLAYTVKIDGRE